MALIAPGGDPWYSVNITLDSKTLPPGVTFDTNGGIVNPGSTPLILVDNRRPNTGSCVDGESCFPTPMVFPPELPAKYLAEFSGHKTIVKFQNGKTYVWVQDRVITSNDDYKKAPAYAWSWKVPLNRQSSVARDRDTFDSDIVYNHITVDLLGGYGFTPIGDFPEPGKPIYSWYSAFMGYKRPVNVTVPPDQKISLDMFYNGKKITVTGTISFSLNSNYHAPDWEWSKKSEGTTPSSPNSYVIVGSILLILVICTVIYQRRKHR